MNPLPFVEYSSLPVCMHGHSAYLAVITIHDKLSVIIYEFDCNKSLSSLQLQEGMGFCLRLSGFLIRVFIQTPILQLKQLVTDKYILHFLYHILMLPS